MKHPQEHTRRAIVKLLREAGMSLTEATRGAEIEIAWWPKGSGQWGARPAQLIHVRLDGTAHGTFPPELFAALCPDP
jgi:hypothetical protein